MLGNLSTAQRFRRSIQLTVAAAALLAVAPAARAQGLFSLFSAPSPYDIERGLDASGYALTGPLVRRGNVYLVDVVVEGRGDSERLVIDSQSGRIIERFRIRPARWRELPPRDPDMAAPGYTGAQNGVGPQNGMGAQNQMGDQDGGWGGAPRPPADIGQPAPLQPAPLRDQVARGEDSAFGTGAPRTTTDSGAPRANSEPGVPPRTTPDLGAPRATSDMGAPVDSPRPKPREVKRRSPPPVARAPAVSTASAGAAATAPAATPARQPPAAAAAAPAPASTVTAKSDSAPPQTAPAKAPPPAQPDNKPGTKTKSVNDLPVTPLD